MALEWLLPSLVRSGIDVVEATQKWQQARYPDLAQGRPSSKVVITVQTRSDRMLWMPDVVLIALEHESGRHTKLYAQPHADIRARIEHGVYRISALHLNIPRDPDAMTGLLGFVRERHTITTDRVARISLATRSPTPHGLKQAGLLQPDGTAPFTLAPRPRRVSGLPASLTGTALRTSSGFAVTPRPSHQPAPSTTMSRPPLLTSASPQAQPSKQQYEKPKRKQKAKPTKPKDDRTPNERARDDFLDEIADRGFELPSDAKHLYYHCEEGWPATRRLVMRKLRATQAELLA